MTRILLTTLFCLFFAASVNAENVILTGGFYSASAGVLNIHTYSVSGPNFAMSGIGHSDATNGGAICAPCSDGLVHLRAHIGHGGDPTVTVTYNGVTYVGPPLIIGNSFTGDASFVIEPVLVTSVITVTGPIDLFSGGVFVPGVFSVGFTGEGTATAVFSVVVTPNQVTAYQLRSVTFNITSPVPEPASLAMLTAALIATVVRMRCKHKRG